MSIFDDIADSLEDMGNAVVDGVTQAGNGLQTGIQGTQDLLTGGPENIINRQELNSLKQQQQDLSQNYNNLQAKTATWISPVNDLGNQISSMLQRSSDYVQGIAVSYNMVLQMGSMGVSIVTAIEKSSFSSNKFLDISIPSDVGGGIADVLNIVVLTPIEGIVNSFVDSATLSDQINMVQDNIAKINESTTAIQQLYGNLITVRDYLLDIGTQVLTMYQRTAGLSFGAIPLKTKDDTPSSLMALNFQITQICEQLESVNGNAFMIFRVLIRLIENGKIEGGKVTDAQLDYLTQKLIVLPNVAEAFSNNLTGLRQFIANFFNGQLTIAPILLNLPPVPDSIKPLMSETPSEKNAFDLNSSIYDPPGDLDLNNIP